METFWELFKQSYIVQGAVTLVFTSTICYLVIVNRSVPDFLINVLLLILGFYFGGKSQQTANRNEVKSENTIS